MNLFLASRPTLAVSEDTPRWARSTSFQVSTDISVLALFGKSWQPNLGCHVSLSAHILQMAYSGSGVGRVEQLLQELSWDTDGVVGPL